jgi:nucleotide-binding universal stress UspA family protein
VVKCPVCGSHVPPEVAVDVPVAGRVQHYCSLRCAEAAEAEGGAPAAWAPALPELPRRILVAVDGSGPSLRAVGLAAALARASQGSVTLLHALDPRLLRWLPTEIGIAGTVGIGPRPEEVERAFRVEAEGQLARCRRLCEEAGVPVTARIAVATPLRAVGEAAADADLVVIGSRGLGAFSGAALGSLSQRVLGETRKPVLVVH